MDLRCHGESVGLADAPAGPHTVHTAASDIITLLRNLKLFPRTLIGHSFGGKVVMSMTRQFGMVLPRPVQVGMRRAAAVGGKRSALNQAATLATRVRSTGGQWCCLVQCRWEGTGDVRWQIGGVSQQHIIGDGAASTSAGEEGGMVVGNGGREWTCVCRQAGAPNSTLLRLTLPKQF